MFAWRQFLGLFAALHLKAGAWENAKGIKYFLATCGGQNCDSVCETFGFQCVRTGQSFPASSALPIFESLGISCKTLNGTEHYHYTDSPNYVAESPYDKDWVGLCIGFKDIPSTIDCHTANNTYVRRLCPCLEPSEPPTTHSTSTTVESPTSVYQTAKATAEIKATTADNEEHSTRHDPGAKLPEQQIGTQGGADRTALIVVAVIAAGLALCLLGLAFLMMWNKKKFSQKRDTKTHNETLHVTYNKGKTDDVGVPDMMDGLTVETETDEENSYYEMRPADHSLHNAKETNLKSLTAEEESRYTTMTGKSTDNILYASITEEGNSSLVTGNNNQLYDRLV